ncbi:MAG: TonB-dependent receptor [Candidatus Marinimicrobia bacterium]|nr:TonB-dependent receptor [Candidatus Neomarinimicrobiota bacterium]
MRDSRKYIIFFLFLIPFLLSAGTTGKIAGRVVDKQTGEPLPGVNILLEDTQMGTATDKNGEYFIINVPVGTYTLRAQMIGYAPYRVKNVQVMVDLTTQIDIEMASADIQGEAVEVIAKRPIVQKDVTSGQSIVSSQEIESMPVESFTDVMSTKAGVTTGANGALHIRGGRSSEIGYMVDGISVSDPTWGGMPVGVENSAIQELQVVSGTFNAEYGQAMSGLVNIVTKDGGKNYHGKISSYLGDYVTNHTETFMNIDDINPVAMTNINANLSGPIPFTNNKLTFFSSFRNYYNEGRFYGKEEHSPNDVMFVPPQTVSTLASSPFGDDLNYYEQFNDLDGNEKFDGGESFIDKNGNGTYDFGIDEIVDQNNNGELDGEYYVDYDNDSTWDSGFSGDGDYVPMSWYRKTTMQNKLTYKLTPKIKFKYNMFYSNIDNKTYSSYHRYKYNPQGQPTRHRLNWTHILKLSHTLGQGLYYDLKFSYMDSKDETYVYENWQDEGYYPNILFQTFGYEFYGGGIYPGHTHRHNTSAGLDFDLAWQMNNQHQFKTGIEAKYHTMDYHSFNVIINETSNWEPTRYSPETSTGNDKYTRNPMEFSYYIQDKIEFTDMIVNMGIRFDYFDANSVVPKDLKDTLLVVENRSSSDQLKTEPSNIQFQWSPRLGISYPITDRGNIHFSYGHFFQIPPFAYLYSNPEMEIISGAFNSILGNANLKPQKTVKYEIGFTQGLTENIKLDVTTYYNDIKNLLGMEVHELYSAGDKYTRYKNRDYGYSKGVTFSLERRKIDWIGASLDYTYQVARGNASDPDAVFYDNQTQPPRESEKKVVPLDWDQTHSLNLMVSVGPETWNVSILGKLSSGYPYTPEFQGYRIAKENSERKPFLMTWDLYANKSFRISQKMNISAFIKIYNIFDRLNEEYVFDDTGRATYSLIPNYTPDHGDEYGRHSLSDYLNRNWYFSAPREIRIGFSIGF